MCFDRTVSVKVDCAAVGVTTRKTWSRRTRAVHVSRSSEVYMHNSLSVRALSLVHMGLGPNDEGQEQCHYGKQNLDHSLHRPELYQKPRGEGVRKERMASETTDVRAAREATQKNGVKLGQTSDVHYLPLFLGRANPIDGPQESIEQEHGINRSWVLENRFERGSPQLFVQKFEDSEMHTKGSSTPSFPAIER